jgi:hypothetical protein
LAVTVQVKEPGGKPPPLVIVTTCEPLIEHAPPETPYAIGVQGEWPVPEGELAAVGNVVL